jgi:hypothetical protein
MNAYTLVDSQTRRKLDEMLKTWKEPVPGSLDSRPVFPPEITRSIESALIKARTAALQQQQARSQQDVLTRGRVGTPPGWGNSPTPPQNLARYPPSANSTPPMPYNRNGPGHGFPSVSCHQFQHCHVRIPEYLTHLTGGAALDPNASIPATASAAARCRPLRLESGYRDLDHGFSERFCEQSS